MKVIFCPALRAEAIKRYLETGSRRSSSKFRMMRPTAPVAPTSATVSNTTDSLLVLGLRDEKSKHGRAATQLRFSHRDHRGHREQTKSVVLSGSTCLSKFFSVNSVA